MLPHTCIQSLDPQFAKFAFLDLSITVGILPGFFKAADGNSEAAVGPPTKAFRLANYPFVLLEVWENFIGETSACTVA